MVVMYVSLLDDIVTSQLVRKVNLGSHKIIVLKMCTRRHTWNRNPDFYDAYESDFIWEKLTKEAIERNAGCWSKSGILNS